MKAITLYEPWASLMAIGAKQNETRPRPTHHRGDICIHAARKEDATPEYLVPQIIQAFLSRNLLPEPNTLGCIVAVVELWDVQPSGRFFELGREGEASDADSIASGFIGVTAEEHAFGNYSVGRFIYRTRNLRRLKTPVPARGLQCVGWTLPADVEAQVRAQLAQLQPHSPASHSPDSSAE